MCTSLPLTAPGSTWWNAGLQNSPTSASGEVCSAASKSWKPRFATISISTMKTQNPSPGHEPPIRSWIASPATLSARPLLPLLDLSHEPLGQETSTSRRCCAVLICQISPRDGPHNDDADEYRV